MNKSLTDKYKRVINLVFNFMFQFYFIISILSKIHIIITNLKCQTQRMETQNSFKTILENESVTVSALLCAETLKIKVKVTDSANEHFGSMFRAEITEQQRKEKLSDFFESLEQVYQHIEEDKLIKVDL